jgi:hypothetical protein
MKNDENVILGQKVIFYRPKNYDADRKWQDFFTRDISVVRSSITESFSSAGESQRKRGRLLVELPYRDFLLCYKNFGDLLVSKNKWTKERRINE